MCVHAIKKSCKLTQHCTGDTFSLLGQRVEVINSRGPVHYQAEAKINIIKIHKKRAYLMKFQKKLQDHMTETNSQVRVQSFSTCTGSKINLKV